MNLMGNRKPKVQPEVVDIWGVDLSRREVALLKELVNDDKWQAVLEKWMAGQQEFYRRKNDTERDINIITENQAMIRAYGKLLTMRENFKQVIL